MTNYSYVAIDPRGFETRGSLEVADQSEAIKRIKEMGLFPTKVLAARQRRARSAAARPKTNQPRRLFLPLAGTVKGRSLTTFTRQLATLVEAGMPLLRALRTLQEQEASPALKRTIGQLSDSIEGGSSLAEAVAVHPRVFNSLYLNMVRAGELSGALELTLRRLAEFMEKAQRIKGKIKAALFYPASVLVVALGILVVLMVFVVPRFKAVFDGLLNGTPLPAFTLFVFKLSEVVKNHCLVTAFVLAAATTAFLLTLRTTWGRWTFDQFKLAMPVLGPLFRKVAISRFARTLGTLAGNGVPILQALTIARDTAGNVVFSRLISLVHENVKQGEPIAPTLKASRVFPVMVAGMVDVGEQTGALPDMLGRVADTYDEEVDNAASAMTALLEPILIVFLAFIVGSIVIAMFLPLIKTMDFFTNPNAGQPDA
jgi:type IV pilus assembly protein PilC